MEFRPLRGRLKRNVRYMVVLVGSGPQQISVRGETWFSVVPL